MTEPMDPGHRALDMGHDALAATPADDATAEAPAPVDATAPTPALEAPVVKDPGDASLLALIDRLASLLDRSELTELEVQVGETGLVLRKPSAIAGPVVVSAPAPALTGEAGSGEPAGAPVAPAPAARPSVKAPLTGIWYASPTPGSAPFVAVGGEVAAGQVVGLIEAMKLFNEIKSDLTGRVVRIHAENGKLVKAKQPLIEVEPF